MKLYLKDRRNRFDATAEYDLSSGEFIVLKGSRVSELISTAPTFAGANSVRKKREQFVDNCIVNKNVVFHSPSSAGNFVTGRSTDGLRTWKDKSGKVIKSIVADTEG